jgi:hypothetical protein
LPVLSGPVDTVFDTSDVEHAHVIKKGNCERKKEGNVETKRKKNLLREKE